MPVKKLFELLPFYSALDLCSYNELGLKLFSSGTQNSIGKTSDAMKNHLSFYPFVLHEISVLNELGSKIEPCGTL